MSQRPELVISNGELSGRRYALTEGSIRLGRSSSNDIHIPDEELSRNHCLFEPVGVEGLMIVDLASANGSFVNGKKLGAQAVELKVGDVIEVGRTRLVVVGETHSTDIDLGLDAADQVGSPMIPNLARTSWVKVMGLVVVLVLLALIAGLAFLPNEIMHFGHRTGHSTNRVDVVRSAEKPTVREVVYEKVKADSNGIFRYLLTATEGGDISISIDDTANDRHVSEKKVRLTPEAQEELNRILDYNEVGLLDSIYSGRRTDSSVIETVSLKIVYSTRVKKVLVENVREPREFAVIRAKLDVFAKSELGIWAIAYSRDRLVELAEQAALIGRQKWDDRDVDHGNLSAAISAFEEACFYLETVDPKPACHATSVAGLAKAKEELDRRVEDRRLRANLASRRGEWDVACEELRILMEMVPDRRDDRHRDAREKLLSAERNLKQKG